MAGAGAGWRTLAPALLAACALLVVAGGAAAGQLEPLATERIESGRSDDGAYRTYHPWGEIPVPPNTRVARFELDWDVVGVDRADEVTFSVCPSDCHERDPLAHTAARPPLTWTTEVPGLDVLAWHAEAEGPAPQNTNLTGTVTFLGPASATPDPAPGAVSPADAGAPADPSPDLSVVVGGIVATLAAAFHVLRRWLPGGLVGLFSRVPEDELLANDTRHAIHELVREEPGVHFREIARRLDLSLGQLEHHLSKLTEANLLVEAPGDGYRCFVPPGVVDDGVKRLAGKLRADGARSVLEAVLDRPGSSVSQVARRAGVSRPTASYHVERLAEAGALERTREGRTVVLTLTRLGERATDQLGIR